MMTIRIIITLLLTILVLTSSLVLLTSADSNITVEGAAGQEVVATFTLNNVAGVDGAFTYSNRQIISDTKLEIRGLTALYNNDMVSGYNVSATDAVFKVTFTIDKDAKVDDSCNVIFKYESTSDGYYPSEPEYHYIHINIKVIKSVDYSNLKKQIENAEKLIEDDYTITSWSALKSALAVAYDALKSDKQSVVDDAANNLEKAIKGLVKYTIDYSELNKQIKLAEDLNKDEYTASSWTELEAALMIAREARSSKNQTTVDNAAKMLEGARNSLVKKTNPTDVDYSELRRQISIAESLKEKDYTTSSWSKLVAALDIAKKTLKSDSQSEVDNAAKNLRNAISNLVNAGGKVDYTELKKQIAIAEGLKEEDYTQESWSAMQIKLDNARKALNSNKQSEVDICAIELKESLSKLAKLDYSALLAAIDSVKKHAPTQELSKLWMQMHELLNRAQTLLTSRDQKAIDSCTAEIIQLLAQIIEKTEELGNSTIIEVEKPIPTVPDTDYCNIGKHLVWVILFWVSFVLNLAFIVIIILFFYVKRRKVIDDTPLVDYDITDDFID